MSTGKEKHQRQVVSHSVWFPDRWAFRRTSRTTGKLMSKPQTCTVEAEGRKRLTNVMMCHNLVQMKLFSKCELYLYRCLFFNRYILCFFCVCEWAKRNLGISDFSGETFSKQFAVKTVRMYSKSSNFSPSATTFWWKCLKLGCLKLTKFSATKAGGDAEHQTLDRRP